MVSHRRYRHVLMAACALGALATHAYAATVGVEPRADYTRINFGFDQPTRLQMGGGGTSLILNFDQPVPESVNGIAPQLAAVASSVQRSADGKQVTITLKENYRTRQFTSGNGVGVDILNNRAPEPPVVAAPPAAEPEPSPPLAAPAEPAMTSIKPPPAPPAPAVTKPPAPTPKIISTPAPVTPVEQTAIKPRAPEPEAPIKSAIITAPAPTPKVPLAPQPETPPQPNPLPVDEPTAIRAEPSPIFSTKPQEPTPTEPDPAPQPVIEDEGPPSPDVPPGAAFDGANATAIIKKPGDINPVLTTKPEPAPEPEVVATPEAEATPPAVVEERPEPVAQEPTVDTGPFLVGVSPTSEGTRMDFPWKQRTAAAMFERGNEIWIVFSRAADMNSTMLRSVLPKSVIRVDQFAYEGASVLRLTTDGKIHATARQPKGAYAWEVLLSSSVPSAKLDVPISGERDDTGKDYLQLSAYDVSDPLRFYDPQIGDLLVVIPTYELGRGVANQKTTPELSILQTQQGIAIASLRDGLTTKRDRNGVQLFGPQALAVSENLPVLAVDSTPVPGVTASSSVMIPYDQWYVAPADFTDTRAIRLRALANAKTASKPEAMMDMVRLYMGQGMAQESLGYLSLLQQQYPVYYRNNRLAMLTAAASLLANRIEDASTAIAAPELADLKEASLWRDAISLFVPPPNTVQKIQADTASEAAAPVVAPPTTTEPGAEEAVVPVVEAPPPAPPPEFDFLKYNKPYIRFYPPIVRQKLAIMAADYYLHNEQQEKAVATYDTLNTDGILAPIQPYAELTIGSIAASKDKPKDALRIYDRLSKQQRDRYIQARARYESLMMRYERGMITPAETADGLEHLRMSWRGDGLERELLYNLARLYEKEKQYDNALRTWKALLIGFPGDSETLTIAGDMTEMFENLFLHGMADDMPPLKSLALFYEFRELTPIGERGDEIIQKLADRLAAVDLIDRATQLLEHQIKFRVSGETRARVGARLGLLYLLNKQPQRALEVLEITNYGAMDGQLRRQRLQLAAQALAATKRPEEGLSLLFNDDSKEGAQLRLEILWNMGDWPNVINEAEDILANRKNLTDPLSTREAEVLLKLALAYAFEGDGLQLKFLRDYYMGLLGDTPYKEIFDFITNDTNPLDTEDFDLVAKQISRTESFLDVFRKKIAEGRLSETVK